MSHLVRCRGGEWWVSPRKAGGYWVFERHEHAHEILWNGVAAKDWTPWRAPAWLPVAWLCCEADPAEGPKFAAAILDAEPEDDTPAMIAAEWLEELGLQGKNWDGKGPWPEDWTSEIYYPIGPDGGGPEAPWHWIYRGPLASWCRHLIATRCAGCGGRRDGEDRWGRTVRTRRETRQPAIRAMAERYEIKIEPDCPLCGFPAHPTPPPLAIPEVVK